MSSTPERYLSNRVLKLNVGFLLSDSAHSRNHDSMLDFPAVRVADDVLLHYVRGPLRLNRTKEGVLVQAHIETQRAGECTRCLDNFDHNLEFDIEELYAYHSDVDTEFRIDDDSVLDLNPLLRAEVLMVLDGQVLCREDCAGLCPDCGANHNHTHCTCADDKIDPRMAVLKQLLDSDS